jgi:outer membrane protein
MQHRKQNYRTQNYRKILALALGVALSLGWSATAALADMKIALIIPQKLIATCDAGKEAAEKLKVKKDAAQKKLDAKAEELKDYEADVRKRIALLNADEKKKVGEDLERQQRDAQRMKEDLERDLQKSEQEILGVVNQFLGKIINDFGEQNGYDLILDASAAVYFSDTPDVTEAVIKLADDQYKKK